MKALTTLEIDGKCWTFDFGMSGWRRIEALSGKKMAEVLDNLAGNATLMCVVVQGALQRHHPEITIDEAGDIATEAGDRLTKAIEDAVGQEGDKDSDRPTSSLKVAS